MKRKHRKQVIKPKGRQVEIFKKYDPMTAVMADFKKAIDEMAARKQIFFIRNIFS